MRRLVVLVSMLASIAACDPSSPVHSTHCTTSTQCTAPMMCIDGTCQRPGDAGPLTGMDGGGRDAHVRNVTGIHVEPAGVTMLTATDGAMPTQAFTVLADYDDGSSMPVTTGVWSADAPVIGAVDRTTGLYTAHGIVGGTSTITVSASGMMATAMVHVAIERNIIDTGAPADAATHFTGTPVDDATRAATLLYPLDHAVFPQNVYPADAQWSGGVAGDLYRVRLDAPGVTVRAYVLHSGGSFGFHWLPTPEAWRALAESATEVDVTVAVDRWEASSNTVITGHGVTVRFANATIRGAIYYWDLGQGRIQRINGDGTGRVSFMPNPPLQPGSSPENRCVACHAISRDGRRMAAEIWGGGSTSAIFDLTGDTTLNPPPMIVAPNVVSFLTASFNADSSRLVGSAGNGLFLIEGNTGAAIASSLPTAAAAHPSWSPDNTQIAFATNTNGGWAVDFTHSDLAIVDVMPGDTFGAPRTILSSGAVPVIARPSWSPDSALIAFQHSFHSRAYEDPGGGRPHIFRPGSVEMVTRDGVTSYDLANLNGSAPNSYYPTFSPFDEGGYFWLAFFSTRDYGNVQAGTAGTGRRQLWVAAVDSTPTGGIDPSFAPYWLPQQNVADENMAAFWTQEACHMDGLHCSTSGECCSGFCRDTGSGPMCVPPDTVSCSHEGEACSTDGDCCAGEGNMCLGNRCGHIV